MSSYLVYICQAVRDRAGLERYWRDAPAAYPKKDVDVLAAYGPCEVLDADQEEHVEGVVIAEFPPFEQTIAWFNGEAYVEARKDRTNDNDYLGILVESGVARTGERGAETAAYVVFVCREILDQAQLDAYWRGLSETLAAYQARALIDHGRFLILEGEGPVQGVTVCAFPTRDDARNWYDSAAHQEIRHHQKKGARYLIVLTEGGTPPVAQRMPQTKVAGRATSL